MVYISIGYFADASPRVTPSVFKHCLTVQLDISKQNATEYYVAKTKYLLNIVFQRDCLHNLNSKQFNNIYAHFITRCFSSFFPPLLPLPRQE